MSELRRVVITGMGAVTPLGLDVSSTWAGLVAGRSGISRITSFDASAYRCQIGGTVKGFDITRYMTEKESRRLDLFCQYAIAASDEAIIQSGFTRASDFEPERCGAIVSSGIGGNLSITQQIGQLMSDPRHVSPLCVPEVIPNMASGNVAIRHHLMGPNLCISTACSSGLHSIGEGSWIIRRGDADVMVCGGAEVGITPLALASFGAMRALTCSHNDTPESASRPFDAHRDGFVLGEGGGVLVLEEAEHAKKRGAQILAELIGYGASDDAFHITAPMEDGSGAVLAIRQAFRHAGIPVEKLDYVNAHGTSTPMNDKMETLALKSALGEHARKVAISSSKSMTGHLLGGAGGFESIVCIKSILENTVHGTMNYEDADPDCDLDYVPNATREMKVRVALNCNYGFGGHNAAVLFAKYE